MRKIVAFFRWLFIDPIREAIFFATLIVIASHAVASSFLNVTTSGNEPRKKTANGLAAADPCETQGKSACN